jgi:hypothetical protein
MKGKAKIKNCTLVLHHLTPDKGITETSLSFHSLEELFAYCVSHTDARLVEQLTISGHDAEGRARRLTFAFQSVTSPKE